LKQRTSGHPSDRYQDPSCEQSQREHVNALPSYSDEHRASAGCGKEEAWRHVIWPEHQDGQNQGASRYQNSDSK